MHVSLFIPVLVSTAVGEILLTVGGDRWILRIYRHDQWRQGGSNREFWAGQRPNRVVCQGAAKRSIMIWAQYKIDATEGNFATALTNGLT